MPSLTLPSPLMRLASAERHVGARRTLMLSGGSWDALATELRLEYPALAETVLEPTGALRRGFVLVLNGAVVYGHDALGLLRPDDSLALIPQIAGG